ncbi:MAG: hypothetical protein D6683_09065, partial [Actinomyces sp.]
MFGGRRATDDEEGRHPPVAGKIRVYELARELGLTNKETLDLCDALGIGVKSHASSIVEPQADRVRRKAHREGLVRDEQPAEPEPAKKAAKKTAKKTTKKAAAKTAKTAKKTATKAAKKTTKKVTAETAEPADAGADDTATAAPVPSEAPP